MTSDNLKIPKIATCNSNSIILKIIRDHSPISRSRIVEYSDQPLTAVSRTISRLMNEQTVLETPLADNTGPRRKRALSLNPNLGHCIAIHYGPDEIGGTILNTAYEIIAEKTMSAPIKSMGKQDRIKTLIDFMKQLKSEVPESAGPCLALAVVDPGVIDEANGLVLMSTLLDNWTDIPIVDIMEKEFNLPVLLTNTSTANIRAVDRFELKNCFQNFIYVEYRDGISCGIKLQGQYINGRAHLAGEFGHMKITDRPIPCRCGAIGCLEAVAAIPALAKKFEDIVNEIPGERMYDPNQISGHNVLELASENNRLAQRVVEEAFTYLGNAVGGLVNLLAPDCIIFDQKINLAGPEAVTVLMQATQKTMLSTHVKQTDLRISKLQTNLPAIGGAVALLDTMIDY